jgi:hypothetical protein
MAHASGPRRSLALRSSQDRTPTSRRCDSEDCEDATPTSRRCDSEDCEDATPTARRCDFDDCEDATSTPRILATFRVRYRGPRRHASLPAVSKPSSSRSFSRRNPVARSHPIAFAAVKTAQRIPLPSLFACEANCTAKALRWPQRCFFWRPSPGSAKVLGGMRTTSSRHRMGCPGGSVAFGVDAGGRELSDLSCNRGSSAPVYSVARRGTNRGAFHFYAKKVGSSGRG